MKKVILSLAIAGLCISGDCHGFDVRGVCEIDVNNNRGNIRVSIDLDKCVGGNQDGVVDLRNISPWGLAKSYFHVNYPELEKKLHTARVVSELAIIGVAVGVTAYYTSPIFHGVVDYAWAFPGMALNYVKSRPEAMIGYLNSMESSAVSIGWNVTKAVYNIGKAGVSPLISLCNISLRE